MSYDLMVFDPSVAPRDRDAFRAWFGRQTDWSNGGSSFPSATMPEAIQNWYRAMVSDWPNMQGPDLTDEQIDDPRITGYSFSESAIYLDFRWTVAEEAYAAVRKSAVEQSVGFYDVSGDDGDGEIYFPGDQLRPESKGAWRQIAQDFKELSNQ